MTIYETRREAEELAGGKAVIQVDGGYLVVQWDEYYRQIREEAESLFSGGWRKEDETELMSTYDFDADHARAICEELENIEIETEEN